MKKSSQNVRNSWLTLPKCKQMTTIWIDHYFMHVKMQSVSFVQIPNQAMGGYINVCWKIKTMLWCQRRLGFFYLICLNIQVTVVCISVTKWLMKYKNFIIIFEIQPMFSGPGFAERILDDIKLMRWMSIWIVFLYACTF